MVKSALAPQFAPMAQILLVEDNASDAFLIESLLENTKTANYQITRVKTQLAATATLAENNFDVCLLDLTLPDTNGFSALIDIQSQAPQMPVLILTGMNDMELARRAVSRGAQDYLLKDEMEADGLTRAIEYALERKRLEKDLFIRASCDALTGLANRESFHGRMGMALEKSKRTGTGVAMLFIDLDRFKPINDRYGHDAGDEVLKTVAGRIKATLRGYDMAARFGGDEFAILLENIETPRDAANIAQKILRELSLPISHRNYKIEVGASIGIAFSDAPTTPDMLMQQADTAMYHTKKKGGSTYRFYIESMHDEAKARLIMEEDLRTALDADELLFHYQPTISLTDNSVTGVEALLRWNHPERGILDAQEFLPVAETMHVMPRICQWQCDQLRHDIALWHAWDMPPMEISFNLSLSQLDTMGIADQFASIAGEDLLQGHRLALEIPGSAIAPISGARYMTLAKLHEIGIALHLDNFGTGELPLTTLCDLPFSLLKIDRELIQKMNEKMEDNVLLSAAIMLAHHLDIEACVVGVETRWQAKMLKKQGCDSLQGYFAAAPLPADKLAEWLQFRNS